MGKERFELKPEHVKLLRAANVQWNPDMCGAPEIDAKRPYGNGDVEEDVCRILGIEWEPDDEECVPEETATLVRRWHRQTGQALAVVLAAGSFEPGVYEADEYRGNWQRVE